MFHKSPLISFLLFSNSVQTKLPLFFASAFIKLSDLTAIKKKKISLNLKILILSKPEVLAREFSSHNVKTPPKASHCP